MTHSSEQVALVLAGSVALTLSGHRHRLETGDATAIPAGCPYAWDNPTDREAKLPIVGRF